MAFFNNMFDTTKYGAETAGNLPVHNDGTDVYANQAETVLSFQHVPSGKSIYFKAFITAFNETYQSDWASEVLYGRADPIYMFKQTTRQITLAFKIPAASSGEAFENLGKVQGLTQFLYPTYVNVQQAQTITQSPLVRLKVMNLARKNTPSAYGDVNNAFTCYNAYRSAPDADNGLMGVIANLTVNHNLAERDAGAVEKAPNTILPKLIDINLTFNVIHEHPLGWNEDNPSGFSEKGFPYGVDLINTDEGAPVLPIPAADSESDNDAANADAEANLCVNGVHPAGGVCVVPSLE